MAGTCQTPHRRCHTPMLGLLPGVYQDRGTFA
jgi:hypothetical protein